MKLQDLEKHWDIIIIGGGVTGAGILREAVRMDLKVLLLEQKDFAWGTSSRSSKLVHGGLRYLKQGKIFLTRDSVLERERLIREAPGLVDPLGFLMPIYEDYGPGKWFIKAGLSLYDLIAMKHQHQFYEADEFSSLLPNVRKKNLRGGFRYEDAQVDDARLVLRLIQESLEHGGYALNYTPVKEIIRNSNGEVSGVKVEDIEHHAVKTLSTRAIINATGPWAEQLHPSPKPHLHLRPLRGSHLVFPSSVLLVSQAVTFLHPKDQRPLFVIPWEGSTIFGTTDLDHNQNLSLEPRMTQEEYTYLIEGLAFLFPSVNISINDAISSFAGIRPILSKGNIDPSKESREHIVWIDKGLVSITGGKLTTFRRLAWDALEAVLPFLGSVQIKGKGDHVFSMENDISQESRKISHSLWQHLYGRYGRSIKKIIDTAKNEDLTLIPGTHTIWAELPFAAQHEQVKHLSDLLLRRVRIGLLTPDGGKEHLERIRSLCEPVLPWNEVRWEQEIKNYLDLWNSAYNPIKTHR